MADNFLGRGWKFPIEIDSSTGRIKTTSGEEDVKEAIKIILLTEYRERVMKPEFGSSMRDYLFSGSTQSTYSAMENEAKKSIEAWEPRVKGVNVRVNVDSKNPSTVLVEIDYTIKSTDNKMNQIVSIPVNE